MNSLPPGLESEMLNHMRSSSQEMRMAAAGVLAAEGLFDPDEIVHVQQKDFNAERSFERLCDKTTDPARRAHLESLLRILKDSSTLVRAAEPIEEQTLVQPAYGPGESDPDKLLRIPDETTPEPDRPKPGIVQRLLSRRHPSD